MAKSLVVVESPAKAKTISKYLGRNFVVKASVGHIKDLPKSKLGVDVDDDFTPHYAVIPAKTKVVKELKAAAKGIQDIYLAADPDREGEAICQHLFEELSGKSKNIFRVLFHEITKNAIQEAFKKPGRINQHKVDAQLTRRILDRLVGYKISPLLWDKVRRGLSAGRVQTVALRMIVEREQEIRAFKSEEYWSLDARLAAGVPPEFVAKARSLDGKKWSVADGGAVSEIVEELKRERFVVQGIRRREKKKYPVPPFITSKLQQEAARKLNFSVKRTMILAQRLYEGIEVGREGSIGLITYMRTDSSRVSESALQEVRTLIQRDFGEAYLPHHPIYYKSKKTAQEAHEAIRPTSVERTPESLRNDLEPDLWKLYSLIWNRFVASQMNPAVFDQTDVEITAGRVEFKATGSIPKFKGFLAVYQESKAEDKADSGQPEEESVLPALQEGEVLTLQELLPGQHFTQPPPRFNEASLVKELESKGIGRPSTYASILSTIQDREYVDKQEGKFFPTETGELVLGLLVKSFQEIFDYEYTARMEDHLDRIESGREPWKQTMRDFYDRFSKKLEVAEKEMPDIKSEAIETDEVCEKCGNKMIIKWGKFGRFMACSGYPDCRNTREIPKPGGTEEENKGETEELLCEKCGRPMVLKRGRFGEFMACSGYPECRNTKKIVRTAKESTVKHDIPLEEKCPVCGRNLAVKHGRYGEYTACSDYPNCKYIKLKSTGVACGKSGCSGEIVERKSRRGKVFYGCSNYPDCDFVVWNKPLPEPCPLCGAPFTVVKTTKRAGTVRFCNTEGCKFKESIETE
ncbi:MAG: type I DNA topoisomerase [Acidobacteriota bacterium]|jgi:DNA topoisomerase-1|nr:type I DNA topoisomerase [Acidobacteriota bacterium]